MFRESKIEFTIYVDKRPTGFPFFLLKQYSQLKTLNYRFAKGFSIYFQNEVYKGQIELIGAIGLEETYLLININYIRYKNKKQQHYLLKLVGSKKFSNSKPSY